MVAKNTIVVTENIATRRAQTKPYLGYMNISSARVGIVRELRKLTLNHATMNRDYIVPSLGGLVIGDV